MTFDEVLGQPISGGRVLLASSSASCARLTRRSLSSDITSTYTCAHPSRDGRHGEDQAGEVCRPGMGMADPQRMSGHHWAQTRATTSFTLVGSSLDLAQDTSARRAQGRAAWRRPSMRPSQGMNIRGVTPIQYGRLYSPLT